MNLSPLQEVERRVQVRAKEIALDMADEKGLAELRAIVDDEVALWSSDFNRGLRAFDLVDREVVAERAYRNLAGYGPLEPLLDDDDVWEVMLNAPDQIFVKRHRGPSGYHDEVFHDDDHVLRTLTKILDDAFDSHRKLDPAEGLQDAQLDNGARLHIVHADVGRGGHVIVNIRKFTGIPFRSLDELVERDMLDRGVAAFLRACVRARLSIVFAGAPGSGKTTLLSCCAAELDPALRVVVAEEVFEADVHCPTWRPCRPGRRGATGARSTSAAWSRGSCAWHPTSPSSVRCATARRSPSPHALVGREGLHDHPRGLGTSGPHAPSLHRPALRSGARDTDAGAQRARERGRRHRGALHARRRSSA